MIHLLFKLPTAAAEFLLLHLPSIQARYYSISSSLDAQQSEVHLTVSLADYHTQGEHH